MSILIDLSGQIVLVTGASQGIGAEVARTFHRAGATVRINHPGLGSSRDDAAAIASELNAARPGSATVHEADVADPAAVQRMMAEIKGLGGLHYLINNAGILRDRTVAKMSRDEWDAVIGVNLSGVFHCCKLGLEVMHDGGAIVNLGSLSARAGFVGQANYAAAKAGVQALTRVLSRECAKRSIRANAIAPGVIETGMAATIPEGVRQGMLQQIPSGRFGRPAEVANVALFLCSSLASYINGHVLEVDGGWRGG
jgi:3-oxoacyl-[acyl-carrier protein] reductase